MHPMCEIWENKHIQKQIREHAHVIHIFEGQMEANQKGQKRMPNHQEDQTTVVSRLKNEEKKCPCQQTKRQRRTLVELFRFYILLPYSKIFLFLIIRSPTVLS
jgi:hypothetical protein